MIGLDTNVLVRYITADESKQAALASQLIESLDEQSPSYITSVTMVELSWVLESAYQFSRSQLVEVFQTLMAIENFKIDRVSVVASAVRQYSESKADFSDCLIERLSSAAGCKQTMTFYKAAAKTAGMALIT
jgi:predicted nucleic-acid-binding protein